MIDEVLKNFESGDVLLLQNEISNLKYLIERAYKMGMRIVLNPSPVNKQISDCDLNKVEYLILNEIEAADILGIDKKSGDILIDRLSENFPDTKIVLTLGENGSIYLYKGQKIKQEIYKTKVVDTTAAGDTFTGYFIAGVSSGISVEMSLKQAAKAASLAVSKKGASPSIPFIEEVLKGL